jgi:hypothetical protein
MLCVTKELSVQDVYVKLSVVVPSLVIPYLQQFVKQNVALHEGDGTLTAIFYFKTSRF